ncbi:MAG: hypothetical protein OH335_02640 [Candidatus Parvarchaeota archaeon]|nr:hypothetical protein [Candidatus Jingweiarchaeum tengchongense]MCW1305645.1 hypothetical protein [Candidatus Jingweiarchaeum tengchongense]
MKKSQTQIVTAILLTLVIITAITGTYLWGNPLIQKNTDKMHIDFLIKKLQEIDTAIRYVAETGASRSIRVDLGNDRIYIVPTEQSTESGFMFETMTRIPIITSSDWIPINSLEAPQKRESIFVNASQTINSPNSLICTIADHGTSNVRLGSVTLEGVTYNVTSYNNTVTGVYDYVCISEASCVITDCTSVDGTIVKGSIPYLVAFVSNNGDSIVLHGKTVDNVGFLGSDSPGIIVGKSIALGETQTVRLGIRYRALQDSTGRLHKIYITCSRGCFFSGGSHEITFTRENIIRDINSTNTYIDIRID